MSGRSASRVLERGGPRERRWFAVRGTVQGVGFRPFVYRLAAEHRLAGWVRNTSGGVEIEVEGERARLERFAHRLVAAAPPLARIEDVDAEPRRPAGETGFAVLPSRSGAPERLPLSPDVATCADCRAEVADPRARRHRYPFTNCTNCGPRFTVVQALPYDRARTTMRTFSLCADCRAEYEDPGDRRFHAEPIACPACGPTLEYREGGAARSSEEALEAALAALWAGRIVAIRGLGGFQLACDATDAEAVARLRDRKDRDAKPFAVMVAGLETARLLCHVDDDEAAALAGPRAPIVLLRRRDGTAYGAPRPADAVAPGLDTLGLMLPYTPLHRLLLDGVGRPLVMTSGNRSGAPIVAENAEAEERLGGVADALLVHDRDIAARCDDSVVRIDAGRPVVLRRARGYAPEPIRLARPARAPVLALGPQLKNTFCLVEGDRAFVSQHLGDLGDAEALDAYREALAHHCRVFGVEPEIVAHDLHPDYAATRLARGLDGVRTVAVQHHHAHVASCMAEHGAAGPVIGVAFDGAGYGPDGAVWGGELLVAGGGGFRRAGHLAYLPLPGGDAAAREPWRTAAGALASALGPEADAAAAALLGRIPDPDRRVVLQMARGGVNSPRTSSIGRLFDAVAALAGVRDRNGYEGQAAMELEAIADPAEEVAYPLPFRAEDAPDAAGVWDPAPLVRAIVDDLRGGIDRGRIAARFHNALTTAVVDACRRVRAAEGPATVALTGGCFQNRRLAVQTRAALERAEFRVMTHHRVPPNDGGISLGQAAVALERIDR